MVAAGTLLGPLALLVCVAFAGTCRPRATVGAKAVYFLTNDADNAIVALKVGSDGKLSDGSIIPTGGAGGAGVGADGNPVPADTLFSQGSVVVSGNLLAAVNAGSNSLSLFHINAEDPTKLTMVGKPVDTLGDFPVTVALSASLKQACVGNTGVRAGIACFGITDSGLVSAGVSLRPFDIGQKTPPTGPAGTVSEAFFTDNLSALIVMVKGIPGNSTGFMGVYPIRSGKVAWNPIKSSPSGTTLLFGTAMVPGTRRLVVTDPTIGAAVIDVNQLGKGVTRGLVKIPGQMATCWATFSKATSTVYVADGAVNKLIGINPSNCEIVAETAPVDGIGGMLDLEAAGDFVYALAPGNQTSIVVFDTSRGNGNVMHIENFHPQGVALPFRVQGLAVY